MLNSVSLRVTLLVVGLLLAGIWPKIVAGAAVGPLVRQEGKVFDPEHQRPLQYSDSELSVRLEVAGEKRRLIISRKTGTTSSVELPSDMAQVNYVRRGPSNRFTVVGMVNGDAWEVAILQVDTARIVDHFLCYEPMASPDGHYVAFTKFFPTHFVYTVTDNYMLYDVARSSEENRPRGVSSSDPINVGTCVYPAGFGNHENDNTRAAPGNEHSMASSVYWRDDSVLYAFADRNRAETSLILVRPHARGSMPDVRTLALPLNRLCRASSNCTPRVESTQFVDKPEPGVHVTFTGPGVNLTRSLDFHLIDFVLAQ